MARSVSARGSTSSRSASVHIDTIEAAALSTGNLKTLATGPRWHAFGQLVGRAATASAATAISCTTTCSRRVSIDAVVESDVNILDIGALRRDRRSRGRPIHRSRRQSAVAHERQRAGLERAAARASARGDPRLTGLVCFFLHSDHLSHSVACLDLPDRCDPRRGDRDVRAQGGRRLHAPGLRRS